MNKRLIVLYPNFGSHRNLTGVMSFSYLGGNWIFAGAVGLAVALGSFFQPLDHPLLQERLGLLQCRHGKNLCRGTAGGCWGCCWG